jgi:hypothetical protein
VVCGLWLVVVVVVVVEGGSSLGMNARHDTTNARLSLVDCDPQE